MDTSVLQTWKETYLTRLREVQYEEMFYNATYSNSLKQQDLIQSEIDERISMTLQHFESTFTARDPLRKRLVVMKIIKDEVLKSKAQLAKNHSSILNMFHAKILNLRTMLTLINVLLYNLV